MRAKWIVKAVVVLSGVCAAAGVVVGLRDLGRPPLSQGQERSDHSAHEEHQSELAQVRHVTARFHDLDATLEAGYELGWVNGSGTRIIAGCVAHPTAGTMGYHYFNEQLMDDLAVDLLQPEVLVYTPRTRRAAPARRGGVGGPRLELEPSRGVRTAPACSGCRCTSSSHQSGSHVIPRGCGSPTRQACSPDWNPNVTCA